MTDTVEQAQVYRVVEAFAFDYNGRGYTMRRGDVFTADHPAFNEARLEGGLFEPAGTAAEAAASRARDSWSATEEATANPGLQRILSAQRGEPDATPSDPVEPPAAAPPAAPTEAASGAPQAGRRPARKAQG